MFEMLIEAIKELFDPTPNRPPPRRRASQSGTPGGQTVQEGEAGRTSSGAPTQVTIEDVFRKLLTGEDEAARQARHRDKEGTAQTETADRNETGRAPRQSLRRSERHVRRGPAVVTSAVEPAAPRARPAPVAKPLTLQETIARAERQDAEFKEERDAGKGGGSLDFAKNLRNNPAAAREAFVYSEIFGRPLSERQVDF